jgi:CBS domain-containing protein
MTKVREIMTKGTEFASMDETIAEAAKRMAKSDIGAMPICNKEKRLQGMLTDRDIVVKVIAMGKGADKTKVSDVAQGTEVVTIGADDGIEEALRTMKKHKVRRLPVIDGTEVVGMVTQGDIATSLPNEKVGDLVEAISAAP